MNETTHTVGGGFAYATWLRNWARRFNVSTLGLTFAQVRQLLSDEEQSRG